MHPALLPRIIPCQHKRMRAVILFISLFLCACSTGIDTRKYNALSTDTGDFSICHGYGCSHKSLTSFTDKEWRSIAKIFTSSPVKSAAAERSKIGKAIAKMEKISGQKTGTSADLKEAVSFKENIHQLDCIDETVNTTQYIAMLQKAGLLKFHERAEPAHRGYLIDGRWPHNTAVLREVKGGTLWAIDSFYRANGEEPYIVPREDWLSGWKPPGATQ